MKTSVRRAVVLVAVVPVAVLFSLTGCAEILRNLADIPSGVKATQGEFSNRVVITWNEVNPSGEKVVTGYEIQRTPGGISGSGTTSGASSTTYTDTNADSGVSYTYQVRTLFEGSSPSLYSSGAIGYALQGEQLKVYTTEANKGWSQFSASERWHTFPAIRGWTYTVHVGGSPPPATLAVYRRGNITTAVASNTAGFTFTATATDDYHIQVVPDGGNNARVRVSY